MQHKTILLPNRNGIPVFKLHTGTCDMTCLIGMSVLNNAFEWFGRSKAKFAHRGCGIRDV